MKHLIIIPTYNEAGNVQLMIEKIFSLYSEPSVLIVDDSSPDGTAKIVENLKNKYKKLYLIIQDKKYGLARAYINGIKWGIKENFDLFTTIDCDFSHPVEGIKDATEIIKNGYDAACGSRYMPKGHTEETNWFKNFISIGGNIYTRFILGKEIYDWTEGFNTYTKECIEKINIDSIKAKGYVFQAEMKYKAIHNNSKVKEFPINFAERTEGKSKMSYKIILEAFFTVLKLRFIININ